MLTSNKDLLSQRDQSKCESDYTSFSVLIIYGLSFTFYFDPQHISNAETGHGISAVTSPYMTLCE